MRWESAEELRAAYDFANLQDFLALYFAGCRVSRPRPGLLRGNSSLPDASQENVKRAEIFLDQRVLQKTGSRSRQSCKSAEGQSRTCSELLDEFCSLLLWPPSYQSVRQLRCGKVRHLRCGTTPRARLTCDSGRGSVRAVRLPGLFLAAVRSPHGRSRPIGLRG